MLGDEFGGNTLSHLQIDRCGISPRDSSQWLSARVKKQIFTKFNHTLLQGSFYHCLPLYKCWCLHQFITDTCDSAALFSCVIAWLAFLCSFLHTLWCKLFPIPVSFQERCCNYRYLNIPQFSFLLKNALQLFLRNSSENFSLKLLF